MIQTENIAPAHSGASTMARVLVADDEESMRYFVTRALSRHGYETVSAEDGRCAITEFDSRPVDVAIVDLKMPGIDGLEVLRELRKRDPEVIVIVMTAFGTIASAVQAMRHGAYDYITKPFDSDELVLLIERGLEHRTTVRENRDLRRLVDHRTAYAGLIGQSPAMKSVYQTIELLQDSDATVLVTGESGTGKELVARAIHMGSRRRQHAFVPVHCAALANTLVDSELFGYVPGAFTGAKRHKQGLISRADGGTLFLDEIAEASLQAQTKLERFLQEREFFPVGGTELVKSDVRIVAATNKDMEQCVEDGIVRRELFFRLNVIPIHLPPLRERREDIPALANHFLEQIAHSSSTDVPGLSVDACVALSNYDWPGNVRELQNSIERLVAMNADKQTLTRDDLPEPLSSQGADTSSLLGYQEAITAAGRAYFENLLRRTHGNVTEAANIAGLSRGHLHRKVSELGLDPAAFRGTGSTPSS